MRTVPRNFFGYASCHSGFNKVVGGRAREAGAVSVRLRHGGPQGAKPKVEVIANMLASIKERGSGAEILRRAVGFDLSRLKPADTKKA